MRAVKNFVFCWVVVFSLWVSLLFTLLIFLPVRFFFQRETLEWSAEYEAANFSTSLLKTADRCKEVILERWS